MLDDSIFTRALAAMQHRSICGLSGLLNVPLLQGHLRLEHFPFGRSQIEFDGGNHFAGAFADAHVAQRVFAGIAPVAEISSDPMGSAGGRARSSSMAFNSTLPMRLTKSLKLSPLLRLARVSFREARDHFRNSLGRNGDDGQAVRSRRYAPIRRRAPPGNAERRSRPFCG